MALWNWLFRAGLALAATGLVWTMWPAPGDRAYPSGRQRSHSLYHRGPHVVIDLGHWNSPPSDARLLGLGDLLTWDGYQVTRARQQLVPELLEDARILIVADPFPYASALRPLAQAVGWYGQSAFTAAEVAAVRHWVSGGGSLLLAANSPGAAPAAQSLAAAFGLTFYECPSEVFLPQTTLGEHRLLSGLVPDYDLVQSAPVTARGWVDAPAEAQPLLLAPPSAAGFCAPGKPLAVALDFGRGRVVALAAQLERTESVLRLIPGDPRRDGNRQLTLNIFHWLSRAGN